MKIYSILVLGVLALSIRGAEPGASTRTNKYSEEFQVIADQFADIQVLRYKVPEFDQLTLQQKKLAYYLTEAGLAGRDIFYDQKYKHNLAIRKTLEAILISYSGPTDTEDYKKLLVYAKRVFFANGIHHHYSNIKFVPECSQEIGRASCRE